MALKFIRFANVMWLVELPHRESKPLPGVRDALQIEQPRRFDHFMIEFLTKRGLFPASVKPARVEA